MSAGFGDGLQGVRSSLCGAEHFTRYDAENQCSGNGKQQGCSYGHSHLRGKKRCFCGPVGRSLGGSKSQAQIICRSPSRS